MRSSTLHCSTPPARVRPLSPTLPLLALTLLAQGVLTPPADAQGRDRGPLVLELPASTRALGLGNTFTLAFPGSDGLFYHPGVVDRAQGLSASVQRYGSSSTFLALSAGQSWLSGGVALGVQVLTYAATSSTPVTGGDVLALPPDAATLREVGEVGVSEVAVSAAYGRRVGSVRLGVVGKLVEQRFGPLQGAAGAFDVGAAASAGPVTLGLAARNLGPGLTMGGETIPFPVTFALGGSTRQVPLGPLDVSGAAALTYRRQGHMVPSAGVEVAYWPVTGRTFSARFGYRHLPEDQSAKGLTFGGAFLGDSIVLEYAFQGFESGVPSHRFGLGWR
jgi:hypothetical protein